jgi:hypothetical protein
MKLRGYCWFRRHARHGVSKRAQAFDEPVDFVTEKADGAFAQRDGTQPLNVSARHTLIFAFVDVIFAEFCETDTETGRGGFRPLDRTRRHEKGSDNIREKTELWSPSRIESDCERPKLFWSFDFHRGRR